MGAQNGLRHGVAAGIREGDEPGLDLRQRHVVVGIVQEQGIALPTRDVHQCIERHQRPLTIGEFVEPEAETLLALFEDRNERSCLSAYPLQPDTLEAFEHLAQGRVEVGNQIRTFLRDVAIPCREVAAIAV